MSITLFYLLYMCEWRHWYGTLVEHGNTKEKIIAEACFHGGNKVSELKLFTVKAVKSRSE